MRTFVLGGGCFWCLDAVYQKTKGVSSVISGYTGGHDRNPDYYSVCSGTTGHAEVVAVTFDEDVIPAEVILDMFFALHDPTTLNRQGYDVGTQYRSSMFYETTEEKILFEEAIERNQAAVAAPDRHRGQPAAASSMWPRISTRTTTPSTRSRATARSSSTRSWPRPGNITLHGLTLS